jgi:hypothetical protein
MRTGSPFGAAHEAISIDSAMPQPARETHPSLTLYSPDTRRTHTVTAPQTNFGVTTNHAITYLKLSAESTVAVFLPFRFQ